MIPKEIQITVSVDFACGEMDVVFIYFHVGLVSDCMLDGGIVSINLGIY